MQDQKQRGYFSRQPAHMILVDLTLPFDMDVCDNLQKALKHFVAITCSLGGPCRTPFLGLFALGNYPEALLPLQHTRGNFSRLEAGIQELRTACREVSGCVLSGCISQGIHDATSMFKRQAHSLLQTAGCWSHLELTLFTCQNATKVVKEVEKVIKEVALDNLKKIQVVNIVNPERMQLMEDITSVASQSSNTSSSQSTHSDAGGMVDLVTVEHDVLSLENYLKGWLHDSGTDREHLHLHLPNNMKESGMTIKCDFQERLLSPETLPFSSQYSVYPHLSGMKMAPAVNTKAQSMSIPLHRLSIISRLPADTICESILFGMPLVLRSTSCWKIEWDELETNQHHFLALCKHLQDKNQVLLAKLDMSSGNPSSSGFRYTLPPRQPDGHFILLPSQSNSLLLKSVAVRELMLPCEVGVYDSPPEAARDKVDDALEQIEELDCYNPLLTPSGLYDCLIAKLSKSNPYAANKRKTNSFISASHLSDPNVGGQGQGQSSKSQQQDQWMSGPTNHGKRPRQMSGKGFYNRTMSNFPTEL